MQLFSNLLYHKIQNESRTCFDVLVRPACLVFWEDRAQIAIRYCSRRDTLGLILKEISDLLWLFYPRD